MAVGQDTDDFDMVLFGQKRSRLAETCLRPINKIFMEKCPLCICFFGGGSCQCSQFFQGVYPKGGLVFTTVLLGLGLMNIVRLRHNAYGEPTQFVGCDKIFLMLSPM